jgi:DNA-directed RNA polymerase specialized sigma24 family protein
MLYEDIKVVLEGIARNVANSFPGYVSADDVTSECWVWAIENQDTVKRYAAEEGGEKTLAFVIKQKAMTFAFKAKADAVGYSPEDLAYYSVKTLRELLKDVFSYEDWQSFQSVGDGQPGAQKIEATGDRLTMLIDAKNAVEKLDERNYNIIIGKFKVGMPDKEIADMLEIQIQSVAPAITRSIKALSKILNEGKDMEPADSYGRRSVRSNAAWRAELSNHYEG